VIGYDEFIGTVRERAQITGEEAEKTACATLRTLAERITEGELLDLAERLPEPLRACADADGPPEPFHVDEFLHRVAERAGVDESAAERDARAVFVALWRAVGPNEFTDMRAQLPSDFEPLLDAAVAEAAPPEPGEPAVGYDEFVDRVASALGADRVRAEQAAAAVLEALAARITWGQAEDIARRLPPELRPALERGRALSGGRAKPMPVDAFLELIARREDVDKDAATEHARAVLRVLRETIGEKEFKDTADQLPGEYKALLLRS
jgi:uncharacterized protein (DUF2267 family)